MTATAPSFANDIKPLFRESDRTTAITSATAVAEHCIDDEWIGSGTVSESVNPAWGEHATAAQRPHPSAGLPAPPSGNREPASPRLSR